MDHFAELFESTYAMRSRAMVRTRGEYLYMHGRKREPQQIDEGLFRDNMSPRETKRISSYDEDHLLSEAPSGHGLDVAMIVPAGGGYPTRRQSHQDNVDQGNLAKVNGKVIERASLRSTTSSHQRSSRVSHRSSITASSPSLDAAHIFWEYSGLSPTTADVDKFTQVAGEKVIDDGDTKTTIHYESDGHQYNYVQKKTYPTVRFHSIDLGGPPSKNDFDDMEEEVNADPSSELFPEGAALGKSQECDGNFHVLLVPAAPTSCRPKQPSFRRRFLEEAPMAH